MDAKSGNVYKIKQLNVLDDEVDAVREGEDNHLTTCKEHGGQTIDSYCRRHGVTCCSLCVSEHHRKCKEITGLPEVKQKSHKSKEFKHISSDLSQLRKQISKLKTARTDDQKRLRQETNDATEEVKNFRQQIDSVLNMLERKGKEYIERRYKAFNKTITEDIKRCEEMLTVIDEIIEQFQTKEEKANPVNLKRGKSTVQEGQFFCKEIKENTIKLDMVKFAIDPKVKRFAMDLAWYGKDRTYLSFDPPPSLPHLYSVKTESQFDFRIKGDRSICSATDVTQLPDGTILVTDAANKRVKQLDVSCKVVDHVDLRGEPMAVCAVGETKAAVALSNTGDTFIQLLTTDHKLALLNDFPISTQCNGLCFKDDTFYILSDNAVCIYSMSGDFIQEIYNDTSGLLQNIITNNDGTILHIADRKRGLVDLDIQGEVLTTVCDPKLNGTCGVTLDENDQVFVCGYHSNNVMQLGHDNQKLGYILTHANGLKNPQSICYDKLNKRLIVTRKCHNMIKVIELK